MERARDNGYVSNLWFKDEEAKDILVWFVLRHFAVMYYKQCKQYYSFQNTAPSWHGGSVEIDDFDN